jgi:hypothetical protein
MLFFSKAGVLLESLKVYQILARLIESTKVVGVEEEYDLTDSSE